MVQKISDFIHFLGAEKEHTIKTCANLGNDFFLFLNLDILFQKALEIGVEAKEDIILPTFLFLNIHREYYLAIRNYLGLNNDKSFLNLRSAIDSGLTAYYLLKNPDKKDAYLQTIQSDENDEEIKKEWKKTFKNIKKTIQDNIDQFPMARKLIDIHDFCSIHAHADAISVLTRYVKSEDRLEMNYFDYDKNVGEYKKWMGSLLFGFFKIFLLFWEEFFEARAKEQQLKGVSQRIQTYATFLNKFREKNHHITTQSSEL